MKMCVYVCFLSFDFFGFRFSQYSFSGGFYVGKLIFMEVIISFGRKVCFSFSVGIVSFGEWTFIISNFIFYWKTFVEFKSFEKRFVSLWMRFYTITDVFIDQFYLIFLSSPYLFDFSEWFALKYSLWKFRKLYNMPNLHYSVLIFKKEKKWFEKFTAYVTKYPWKSKLDVVLKIISRANLSQIKLGN